MKKIILSLFCLLTLGVSAQQNALMFDGVDDRVEVADNTGFNAAAVTIEAWIYANNWKAQQWQGTIVGHDGPNSSGYVLRCGAGGRLSFAVGNGSWPEVVSGPIMAANTWNHVAAVINSGKSYIFVNGTLIDSATISPPPLVTTQDLYIGESSGFSGRVFDGAIDEVRIWNVARTEAQINANKAVNLPATEPGLVAYYQFNQISGNTTNNLVNTTNTVGTLVNFGSSPWVSGYVEPTIDLSATGLISPDPINLFSNPATRVRMKMENKGVDTINSFLVGYKYNNRAAVLENMTRRILPGETFEYSFQSIISNPDSVSDLKVFATATNDANPVNDTLEVVMAKPASNQLLNIKVFDKKQHNFGAAGQSHTNTVTLPDNNTRFEQILMHISVSCPPTGCDPWDQPAKVSLIKDGVTYELARYVTPYGKGCGPWTVDVTSFKNVLQGSCLIESYIQVWGQSGWLLDVDLEFLEGKVANPYQKLSPLWDTDNWVYGDPNISYDLPAQQVNIDPLTKETELRMTITGHGQANTDNAAEFSAKTHTVKANSGTVTTHYLWKTDCAQNACTNQFGTYLFSRAGWCPGQAVDPFMVNLNSQATAGSSLSVDYELETYVNLLNTGYNGGSHTEPHYKIHSYLVEKSDEYLGDGSFKNAVASRITSPLNLAGLSTNTTIKVMVANLGAVAINNADMYYYINDSLYSMENTNLNIQPGDSVEYTFNVQADMGGPTPYILTIMVNADDEAASDDLISESFGNFISIPESQLSSIKVYPNPSNGAFWIDAQGLVGDVELELLDISGKAVFKKTVIAEDLMEPYLIQQKVAAGIYFLHLTNKGETFIQKLTIK